MTVYRAPTLELGSVYVDFVAPATFTPLRYHWYVTTAATGWDCPAVTRRVPPTRVGPLSLGASTVSVMRGIERAEEVVVTLAYPVRDPVTLTVSLCPASYRVGV